MKIIFAAVLLLMLSIAAWAQSTSAGESAQRTSTYQSVGEDFGRTWISNFQAENNKSQAQNQDTSRLWSWGGIPVGKTLVNGLLANANNSTMWNKDNTLNWLGEGSVDPYTGLPIYGFIPAYMGGYTSGVNTPLPPGLQSSSFGIS